MKTIVYCCMAIAALLVPACSQSSSSSPLQQEKATTITIKGSDTMVHLVSEWAEKFMATRPEFEVSVTGGGSGTGISALLNKSTDLCAASREMSAEEKAAAKYKGIDPQVTTVANDGIAIIVNPSNPVTALTLEQLKKIFTGATTDWKDVGGNPGGIVLLSRESSSGTYMFFQEHVLKKHDYAPAARLMPATSAIVKSVSDDANAIGYVGLGYAAAASTSVKVLPIKAYDTAPAIVPSEATVKDGTYSIARPLYLIAGGSPSPAAAAFLQFCLSDGGQAIVKDAGYVTVD